MDNHDRRDDAGEGGAAVFDRVWRSEEAIVRALIDDVRSLRSVVNGAGRARADILPDAGNSAGPETVTIPTIEADPADEISEPDPGADAATDLPNPEPAATRPGDPGDLSDMEPQAPPSVSSSDARAPGSDAPIVELKSIDEETGDCFCYDIVDRCGDPFDHPYYEINGHEIRLKDNAPAAAHSDTGSIYLKVTNAAGDERRLEYCLTSGEFTDLGREAMLDNRTAG